MKQPINLMHLQFFVDAAALKSVSEAAKKNFVTQSAISQGIAKLEKVLGANLVNHSRQNFTLTAEGKVVLEQARAVFSTVREMGDKIHEQQGKVAGILPFACTNSLAMSFIDNAYLKMQKHFPEVQLKPYLGGLQPIRNWLQEGVVECAIVLDSKEFSSFQKQTIKKGQFHLYKHAKTQSKAEDAGIFVDSCEGLSVHQLQELFQKQYKKALPIRAELGGWEVVARFAEKNIGLGFFPDYVGARYQKLEPYRLHIPAMPYEIVAITLKGHTLSRAASAFLTLLQEEY